LRKAKLKGIDLMNVNFFQWIRAGVKQSVLMGVSDAVNELGQPEGGDDVQKLLTTAMSMDSGTQSPKKSSTSTNRKKLGRTLSEVSASEKKAA
jgi:hypothetical protein